MRKTKAQQAIAEANRSWVVALEHIESFMVEQKHFARRARLENQLPRAERHRIAAAYALEAFRASINDDWVGGEFWMSLAFTVVGQGGHAPHLCWTWPKSLPN